MTVGSLYEEGSRRRCIVYFNITACCASGRLLTEMLAKLTRRLLPLNSGSFVEGLRVHGMATEVFNHR